MKKIIKGTSDRPRLVVFKSNRFFYAQVVDDSKGITLASVNKLIDPIEAGKQITAKLKVKQLVFDRAGYKYHGNIKKFVDTVREGGIKI